MHAVYKLTNFQAIEEFRYYPLSLLFFSRGENADAMKVLQGVRIMAQQHFKELMIAYIDLNDVPTAASSFSVFKVPAMVLYTDGQAIHSFDSESSMQTIADVLAGYYRQIYKS